MELGLYSFGELIGDGSRPPTTAARVADLLAMARLADDAGLAVFGIGEHHRRDLPLSSPMVVLAAIAHATRQIRLTTAATVLGALDPVRVFEDAATLDVVSGGRAELMVGRGGFVDAFALFGRAIADYDALFEDHLGALAALAARPRVTWRGRDRALIDVEVAPQPVQAALPIWAAVGSPDSAARAGAHGLGLVLPGNGAIDRPGDQALAHLHALIEIYRTESAAAEQPPATRRIAIAGHAHVDRDGAAAHAELARRLAREREHFGDTTGGHRAPLACGSPSEVVERLHQLRETFGVDRVLLRIDPGGAPLGSLARVIELLGALVAPALRKLSS